MKNNLKINGVYINNINYDDLLIYIENSINKNQKKHIVTVNPEMILYANKNKKFFNILKQSNINTADGFGILWSLTYINKKLSSFCVIRFFQFLFSLMLIIFNPKVNKKIIQNRLTGSDLTKKLVEKSELSNIKLFFLGGEHLVADLAKKNLSKIYKNNKIVGTYMGSNKKDEFKNIKNLIEKSSANVLLVAFGSPKQEFWINEHLKYLKNINVAIGVGGSFDFFANKIKRAPKLFQNLGIEWLWRLFQEPRRIKRIINATIIFPFSVFKRYK